jgi:hypothetical protein
MLEKTIDEVISDLIQSFDDELQNLTNEELEEKYEERMGEEVKIIA